MPRGCLKLLFAEAASNTLKMNSPSAEAPSASVTRSLITAVPFCPLTGVICTVRLAPLPPRVMFAFGTRLVFEEVVVTSNDPAAVSASPIVKVTAAGVCPGLAI